MPSMQFPKTRDDFVELASYSECIIEKLTRFRDDSKKLVGLEFKYKDGKTVKLGKQTANSGSCMLEQGIRSIKISENGTADGKEFRSYSFHRQDNSQVAFFTQYSPNYPTTMKARAINIPGGYKLAGFAIDQQIDGTVKAVGFILWRVPISD